MPSLSPSSLTLISCCWFVNVLGGLHLPSFHSPCLDWEPWHFLLGPPLCFYSPHGKEDSHFCKAELFRHLQWFWNTCKMKFRLYGITCKIIHNTAQPSSLVSSPLCSLSIIDLHQVCGSFWPDVTCHRRCVSHTANCKGPRKGLLWWSDVLGCQLCRMT